MKKTKPQFSSKTFTYFDSAIKNKKKIDWLEKHKSDYNEFVKAPFENLTQQLKENFSNEVPRIDFLPRKISRPLRRNPDADGAFVRTHVMAFFSEKATSQFEWNPGIYISIGSVPNDNVVGLGLYMVSSRQMSLLRHALVDDYAEIDSILTNKKLKKSWGNLQGEIYKRFPKGFDENSEAAKYLKHKQFFLSQKLTRKQICDPKFCDQVVKDIEIAIPFLQWIRSKVGVYQRNSRF